MERPRSSTLCSAKATISATARCQQDTLLDSNPLERERGITILAKNVAINYTDPRDRNRYQEST